jgi:DNA-binding transcriptional MerR regulator
MLDKEKDKVALRHKEVVERTKGINRASLEHQNITLGSIAEYLRTTEFKFQDGVITPDSLKKQLNHKIKELKKQWREI